MRTPVIIPAARFLHHVFSCLQKFDLAFSLPFYSPCDGLEGVQVFHLCSGSECFASRLTDRQVYVRAHGPFLEFTVGHAQILHHMAQLLQIRCHFLRAPHIRFGNDLNKRDSASVIVHKRAVLPLVVDQLTRVFFHVHFMDPDFLLSGRGFDLHPSVTADRQVKLGNLIVLGIIRIKIVLTVKPARLVYLTVGRDTGLQGELHHLTVQYRK